MGRIDLEAVDPEHRPLVHRVGVQALCALAERELGSDDLDVAAVLNHMGMLNKYTGELDRAEPACRRVLDILEDAFGPDDPELASLYHNLGGLEHARGAYEAGELEPAIWLDRDRRGATFYTKVKACR